MDLSYLARTIDTIEAIYGSEIGSLVHPFPLELYDDLESLANKTPARTRAERAWRINRLARAVENDWRDELLSLLSSATIRDYRAPAADA
jgi:hypothetical protein